MYTSSPISRQKAPVTNGDLISIVLSNQNIISQLRQVVDDQRLPVCNDTNHMQFVIHQKSLTFLRGYIRQAANDLSRPMSSEVLDLVWNYFDDNMGQSTIDLDAIYYGYLSVIIPLLLRQSMNMGCCGFSHLNLAVERGHYLTVHLLMKLGVKINPYSNVLIDAFKKGDHNMVTALLSSDTRIWYKGHTIEWVCKHGKVEWVQQLVDAQGFTICESQRALFAAVEGGNTPIVQFLLPYLSVERKDGRNLLHLAAEKGHLGVTKVIYEHIVKEWNAQKVQDFVNATDRYCRTPLVLAKQNGNCKLVRFLLSRLYR